MDVKFHIHDKPAKETSQTLKRRKQEGAALRVRPLWGRPCSNFTMGISFSVRVKAHVRKTIRKK